MGIVRLFIALGIPAEVKANLAAVQDELRGAAADVKWTRPEGLHVTLKFLGETDEEQLAGIREALFQSVNGFSPFELEGRGTGFFPDERRPRVIWAGLVGEAGKLAHLQRRVEAECEAIGFPSERRAFEGHLTLGRIRSDRNVPALVEAARRARDRTFGTIPVDRVLLYRSELKPSGAVYHLLAEEPFRD